MARLKSIVRKYLRKLPFVKKVARKLRKILSVTSTAPVTQSYYPDEPWNPIYPVATKEQQMMLKNAIRISFCGDLILLRELEESAYDLQTKTYDFSSLFNYVSPHWKSSDLAIGVFEGPMAGEECGYTTSNCEDPIPLYINMPDSFAQAVKDAGINFVTTANNHLYDRGVDGIKRTLNVLDSIGLDHTGSFRTLQEKNTIKIVSVRDKKIVFLAYTYCPNYKDESIFFNEDTSCYTNGLVSKYSPYFTQCKQSVIDDFNMAKNVHPDMIIVLPHMGTQFASYPDEMQEMWMDLFVEQGADAIFCCHAHHVQPIKWVNTTAGKNIPIIYCPGNFVNSYTQEDGDASILVDMFIDSNTFNPFAISYMPLYAYCDNNGTYTGLPMNLIYKVPGISHGEVKHVEQLHRMVTRIVSGHTIALNPFVQEHYIFASTGYTRMPVNQSADISISYNSLIARIKNSKSVCFIGDSITEGTVNGGFGWFEPIMANFPNIKVSVVAKGSATSAWILEHLKDAEAINADLYILAFGCNDIRYREEDCALTDEEFVRRLSKVVSTLGCDKCIVILPWISSDFDPYCPLLISEKNTLYQKYIVAISSYCHSVGVICLDANAELINDTNYAERKIALQDHIHPNAGLGIQFYSKCVLKAEEV